MGCDQADAAQRAAWPSAGQRLASARHFLGHVIWGNLARSTGSVWPSLATTASFAGAAPCLEPHLAATVQMSDTSIVRVHLHGACIARIQRQSMGRSVPKEPPSHPALAAACRW